MFRSMVMAHGSMHCIGINNACDTLWWKRLTDIIVYRHGNNIDGKFQRIVPKQIWRFLLCLSEAHHLQKQNNFHFCITTVSYRLSVSPISNHLVSSQSICDVLLKLLVRVPVKKSLPLSVSHRWKSTNRMPPRNRLAQDVRFTCIRVEMSQFSVWIAFDMSVVCMW